MATNQIAEFLKRLGSSYLASYASGAQRYSELLTGAGRTSTGAPSAELLQQRYAAFVRNEGPRIAQQLAEASVNYYTLVLNAGVETVKLYVEQVLQAEAPASSAASPSPSTPAPTDKTRPWLLFRGEQGDSPSNAFVIANNRSEVIEVGFDLAELASDDGQSRLQPTVRFDPSNCRLGPNSQQVVRCSVLLSEQFRPGVDYRGQIQVAGFPDMSMSVTVRAEPSAKSAAPQETTPAKVAAKPRGKGRRSA